MVLTAYLPTEPYHSSLADYLDLFAHSVPMIFPRDSGYLIFYDTRGGFFLSLGSLDHSSTASARMCCLGKTLPAGQLGVSQLVLTKMDGWRCTCEN